MKKEILITLLCAGLMLVTPFSVVARENTIRSNLSEQPDLDGLVAQLRVVINEILQKYGYMPMVSNLCYVIINSFDLIGKIVFCIFLFMLAIIHVLLVFILAIFKIWSDDLITNIIYIAATYDRNCPPGTPLFDWLSSLFTIYTLKDIDDITNLAKGCPCLQE